MMNIPLKYEDVVARLDVAERRIGELESVMEMFTENSCDRDVVELCKQALNLTEEPVYQLRNTKLGFVWRDADFEAYASAAKLLDYERRIMYAEEPAPVAVVMPDRQSDPGPVAGLTRKWAEGWNDALDAVARLNGVKP